MSPDVRNKVNFRNTVKRHKPYKQRKKIKDPIILDFRRRTALWKVPKLRQSVLLVNSNM